MEFQETGLLNHPDVHKAYDLVQKMAEEMDPTAVRLGVEVAQLLSATGCKNVKPILWAILAPMPEDTVSLVEERFGGWIMPFALQIDDHARFKYEFIGEASEDVKLYTMAEHLIHLRARPQTMAYIQLDAYEHMIKGVNGTTSCPELEKQYKECISQIAESQQGSRRPNEAPSAGIAYPPFDKQKDLPNTPEVRNAYKYITEERGATGADFNDAVRTAYGLAKFSPSPDSALIAAALVDIGGFYPNEDEWTVLEQKIGADAVGILSFGSAREKMDKNKKTYCPEGFAKICLTRAYVKMGMLFMELQRELQRAKEDATMSYTLLEGRMEMLEASAQAVWQDMMEGDVPLIKKANMPELERRFRDSMQFMTDLIEKNSYRPKKKPSYKPSKPGF